MTSEKKTEANRQNALRHGILLQQVLLPAGDMSRRP
jgi:hypothetical protein